MKYLRMKKLFLIVSLFITSHLFSQYYYNDIIANQQSNQRYHLLILNKVNKVTATNLDANNQVQDNFLLEELINASTHQTIINSKIASGKTSVIKHWYEKEKILKTEETSNNVNTQVNYNYDEMGRVKTISSNTIDTSFQSESTEVHIWTYNSSNQPQQMWNIKNKADSVLVDFLYDDQGNVIEEHWFKKNVEQEIYYYYYNDKKQLTDIVRFSKKAKQLLPDFLFEYDNQNHIIQMTQTLLANNNYLVWKYLYNDKGLKQEEICTNRQKQIMGKIEYKYE